MVVGMLEGPDLIIVLVIVMIMFGAKRLPELARGLGQAKKEFENAVVDKPAPTVEPTTTAVAAPAGHVTILREEYDRLRAAAEHHTDQP